MKYKVLEEVEILGEVRAVDTELEIDEETAAPFVIDGKLGLVGDEGEAGQGIPPSDPANPIPPQEENKGWAGNHSV